VKFASYSVVSCDFPSMRSTSYSVFDLTDGSLFLSSGQD
jgi:hypothetical protein